MASTNTTLPSRNPNYSELDALFTYSTTLIDIHPDLVQKIVTGYKKDAWWAKIFYQVQENKKLGLDQALLPFVRGDVCPVDSDPYYLPRPEQPPLVSKTPVLPMAYTSTTIQAQVQPQQPDASGNISWPSAQSFPSESSPLTSPAQPLRIQKHSPTNPRRYTKADLLFFINRTTGVQRIAIPPTVVKDIMAIAHGKGHPGFARCYKIIFCLWYIRGLTKLLHTFIRHCPQCLALQTRRHPPYGSLQPIHSPPIPFFTFTLDFVLAFPRTKKGYNALMSVTCKFSKCVTLIPGMDTWTAEDWANSLLQRLNLIDWELPGELITDRDPKFLERLWKAIFEKLGVKLLYSTAYHPQTDGSSERTNQTVEIPLQFFIYTLQDISLWLEILPRNQSILNNTSSSTTSKTPNEIAYGFSTRRPLDLLFATHPPEPQIARAEAADAIAFATSNQKEHYDRKHQPLFMKVGEWTMLRLHKGFSIPSSVGVTKN